MLNAAPQHALTVYGEPAKYPAGFSHFDYTNPLDEPVPDVLRVFGNLLMTKLTATPILSLFRLVVGEAERFPHLAETFYERGPRRGKARAAV